MADQIAGRSRKSTVEGSGLPRILLAKIAHARKLPDNLRSIVRRTVINHDDFVHRAGLASYALQALAYEMPVIISADDDRNARLHV